MTDRGASAVDVERFLNLIWLPGDVREFRCPKYNKFKDTASGYFDDVAVLAKVAAGWDGKGNLYVTLNPVNPALLARANNRIEERAERATADVDIIRRHWFYLDIDPVRLSGISSTEDEREAALAILGSVTEFLSSAGWSAPVTAMSGNGYVALYRIDLPNSTETAALIKAVLESLASRFNSAAVSIDPVVYNASRTIALIGTAKVKGDALPDRPHRRSCLLSVPTEVSVLAVDQLQAVAKLGAGSVTQSCDLNTNGCGSLRDLLDKHGIEYKVQPADAQGIAWYHVRRCPFHEDGDDFECGVGQKLPDGRYAGHCFHPEGADKGWQEWKDALHLRKQDPLPEYSSDSGHTEEGLRLTDTWNAHHLVSDNRDDLLWCEVFKQWYVYDGTRYSRDVTREIERRAERTVTGLYRYASTLPGSSERRRLAEWTISSESRHRLTAMVESAKRMVPVDPTEFDRDPLLFNVANGTIDLRTQRLQPHDRADRLSKVSAVQFDPMATCPQWIAFLNRIFAENQTLIDFMQRLFGYCLTGLTSEQTIAILYGTGANGKSTLLHVLRSVAGDYAYHCRPEVFTAKRNDSQGFELVPLAGARVVTSTESSAGRRLDEALVKEMTGGEPINCAPKYGSFFTFQPQFKPLLATNHKPEIRGADEGIWRRVQLVPFTVTIPENERDLDLPSKLDSELPGILNWALQGAKGFLAAGLRAPDDVRSATANYRAEQDVLGNWIEERCTLDGQASDVYADLYKDYSTWCEGNKEEPVNKSRFSSSLDERGCPSDRGGKGKRMRLGIARRVTGDAR